MGGPPRSRVQDTELVVCTPLSARHPQLLWESLSCAGHQLCVLETGLSGYLQVQSVRLVVSLQSKLLLAKQGRCRSRFRWGLGVIQVLGTET